MKHGGLICSLDGQPGVGEGWMDTDGNKDGWTDRWTDRQTDGWKYGWRTDIWIFPLVLYRRLAL